MADDSNHKVNIHGILPEPFPPEWAAEWGEDRQYGLWACFTYKSVSYCFRWIKPGRFMMGSPNNEPERDDDEELHEVTLTNGFWLGETACTQNLWKAVVGRNPSRFKGGQRPVEEVSWDDCMLFIDKLNENTDFGFRLPTEAEWEYACRAGTDTPFSFGRTITPEQVNYNGKYPYADAPKGLYREETVDVKSLSCNGWGLYDMHGNVWEWCADWYGEYPTDPIINPTGPERGESRVLRGGCWIYSARNTRSAYRGRYAPDYRDSSSGFRLARGHQAGKGSAELKGSSKK